MKIKVSDVSERKIFLREPKSGKEAEVDFMPEPVAKRLNDYIKDQGLQSNDRLFPICYSTVRYLIKRLGSNLHVRLRLRGIALRFFAEVSAPAPYFYRWADSRESK